MATETPYNVTKNNVVIEEVIEEVVIDTFDIIDNVFRTIYSGFIIIIYKLSFLFRNYIRLIVVCSAITNIKIHL